jgi:hypothetical protein
MLTTVTIEIDPSLLRKAELWAENHQLSLSTAISHLLQQLPEPDSEYQNLVSIISQESRQRSILELDGLGQEIWQGIDAQRYINEERNSWNG